MQVFKALDFRNILDNGFDIFTKTNNMTMLKDCSKLGKLENRCITDFSIHNKIEHLL